MPDTVRAFVALPVEPPPPLRSQLRKISTLGRVVRAVRPESLHITLRFLGDISAEQLPAADAAVRQATDGAKQVPLLFRGLGAFPSPERPAVLWAGLEQAASVEALAERLSAALDAAGFPPDRRGFRPHLTLARIRARPPASVFELLAAQAETDYGQTVGQDVVLYQSELRPEGARHTALETVCLLPLAGGTAEQQT